MPLLSSTPLPIVMMNSSSPFLIINSLCEMASLSSIWFFSAHCVVSCSSYYLISCHAISSNTMLTHVTSHVFPYHLILPHSTPWHHLRSDSIPFHIIKCRVTPCHPTQSHSIPLHLIPSHPISSHLIPSHLTPRHWRLSQTFKGGCMWSPNSPRPSVLTKGAKMWKYCILFIMWCYHPRIFTAFSSSVTLSCSGIF